MIQTRTGLFETNSSSTHAIAVTLDRDTKFVIRDLYNTWRDYNFSFGRETYRILENWDEKLGYIYTVLLDLENYKYRVFPEIDIPKFKTRVLKVYQEVVEEIKNNSKDGFDSSDPDLPDTTPDQIMQILDFINDRTLGLIPQDAEPNFKVNYRFEDLLNDSYGPYVDHTEPFCVSSGDDRRFTDPCVDFIEKLMSSDDYLKYFLFSDESYITIGGDEYRGYNLKTLGFEGDYNDESEWDKRVEEYRKTHDVYFKGN